MVKDDFDLFSLFVIHTDAVKKYIINFTQANAVDGKNGAAIHAHIYMYSTYNE